MTMMEKLFSFQGRMRRQDYWIVQLICIGAVFTGMMVFGMVMFAIYGLDPARSSESTEMTATDAVVVLAGFCLLIPVYWAQIAAAVKRLHDQDLSGWLYLLVFVPLGGVALLVLCGFIDGTKGPNKFGLSPKGLGVQSEADRVFG